MVNQETRSIAVMEMQDDDGNQVLIIHQLNPETYYGVFDTAKVTRGFKSLEEIKEFLQKIGFQEV